MPEFTVEFEVYCGKCGAGICNNSRGELMWGGPRVTVDPCEACLASAKDEGFAKGERSAFDMGGKVS